MKDHTMSTTRFWITSLSTLLNQTQHWIKRGGYRQDHANILAPGCGNQSDAALNPLTQINARGLGLLRRFERLQSHCEQGVREIERAVLRQVKVPLTSNQFSALVSLTYHLGEASLKRSMLLSYLNAGCYQQAADEFERWIYIGSRPSAELRSRRRAEKRLFLRIDP